MNYREKIIKEAEKYYQELNASDFCHNFDHFLRVERLAKRIGKDEGADLEILEAASLLFDIARGLEDKGEVDDHARAGAEIARKILGKIGFPKEKVEPVCHAIEVHRKSVGKRPKSVEAKILQDADYLDALGIMAVIRTIASSFQSKKYKRPIFIDRPYRGEKDKNISAVHHLLYLVSHPKLQPKNLYSRLGRKLAEERFEFMKNCADRFVDEWSGKR